MTRRSVPVLAALLAALALASFAPVAVAGGHVDIKASALPAKIEAGKSLPVTFAIRWPNGEPVSDARPVVVAKLGRDRVEVAARPTKRAGEYLAEVTLPREGAWSFVVDSKICGNTCTLSPVMALASASRKGATAAR